MATFAFPTSAELTQIAQEKMPALQAARRIFDLFPTRNVDAHIIEWEQMDNFLGLQQVRGMDGSPPRVKKIGLKRYLMQPGIYGEFGDIDENELTTRRRIGTWNTPIDISDLVMPIQDQLLQRRLDRIEAMGWTLLATGTFSIAGPTGNILHTDSYTTQTFTAGTTWATVATAAPLANFRSVQLLGRGKGVNFGAQSTAFMNRSTYNNLISNTNANDLGGRRLAGLAPANRLADINQLLTGDDLPMIEIYDNGYLDDAAAFQLFIPNNKVIVVGQRPAGQTIGEYRFTRNANNPDLGPGPYMRVIDRGEDFVPRRIDVHDGHNGGFVIWFPSAIVVMTV